MDKKNSSMTLFRKLLLSFFSKKAMTQAGLNPAAMFISFVSAKQFFGLINRRIVEHYKLNMFDITIDPFEAKVGLGENPSINIKDLDFYYGYNSAANFIGYKFYSPNNIATILSILSALCTHEAIAEKHPTYFKHLLFTVYIFVFLIIAKIKICPEGDLKTRYDRTMTTFWSLYVLVFEKTKTKISQKTLLSIKTQVMSDVRWSFCIYHCSNYCANYFSPNAENLESYYNWLFMDESTTENRSLIIDHYINNNRDTVHNTHFDEHEKVIIDIIIPADLIIRYIFGDKEGPIITRHVLSHLYEKEQLNEILDSFTKSGNKVQELLDFLMNPTQLKRNFFLGIQQYVNHIIKHHLDLEDEEEKSDTSPFSSFIDEDEEQEQHEVESGIRAIKIETGILDRLINFYISYIGGMQIARGDNGYIRLHKPRFLQEMIIKLNNLGSKPASLVYYANNFFLYTKNLFYYSYAYDHVRAGKENFSIPVTGTIENHQPNMFVITTMQQNTIIILLQDINIATSKLFVRKGEILGLFQKLFGKKISTFLKYKGEKFIHHVYKYYNIIIDNESDQSMSNTLLPYLTTIDIEKLKDRLYTIDFWLSQDCAHYLAGSDKTAKIYDTMPILSILATMRETLLGLILYYTYIKMMEESHQKAYYPDSLLIIYCRDILNLDESIIPDYIQWISKLYVHYSEIFSLWINLDDNNEYCYIGLNNWIGWITERHTMIQHNPLPGEDIIWLLGYIKTITYYNKRYLIPEL